MDPREKILEEIWIENEKWMIYNTYGMFVQEFRRRLIAETNSYTAADEEWIDDQLDARLM